MNRMNRLFIAVVMLFGVLFGGLGLVQWAMKPEHFPLKAMEIQNVLKHVAAVDVSQAVAPHMAKGFFGLNVEATRQSISQLPWVRQVAVKRQWPDRIVVNIEEHIPQARFINAGLVNTQAEVFYPPVADLCVGPTTFLPLFEGPESELKKMLEYYLDAVEKLLPLHLRISALHLSETGEWRISLETGITIILGKTAFDERMNRFVLAYQANLEKESQKIAYVDLRYTTGFAIGWKTDVSLENTRRTLIDVEENG